MPSRPSPASEPRPAASRPPERARARAAGLWAAALLLAACGLHRPEEEAWFDLEADPALAGFSRVTVALHDSLGNFRATLFDDSLASPDALRRLPAGPYRGGPARIVIEGWRGGRPVYRETRVYDGEAQKVLAVDIYLAPSLIDSPATGPLPPRDPVLEALAPDTVISIGDSAGLWAQVADADGDLRAYGMDCDGDGIFEDTGSLGGSRATLRLGRRFADSGTYACRLEVRDAGRRKASGRLTVRVERDPPVADAGADTTVAAGTRILLHARGRDRFGPIVFREWKIGARPFTPVAQQETVLEAPSEPGVLPCILRVTDSDGLTALDTLLVTVIPRTPSP